MNTWNYRPGVAALQRADLVNRPEGETDPPEPGTIDPPAPPAPAPADPTAMDWARRMGMLGQNRVQSPYYRPWIDHTRAASRQTPPELRTHQQRNIPIGPNAPGAAPGIEHDVEQQQEQERSPRVFREGFPADGQYAGGVGTMAQALGASSLGPSGYGPGGARTVEPRNALGYTVGQAPGLPQAGFRMAGTDGGPGGVPTPPTRAAGATTAAAPGRPSGGGAGLGAGLGGPVSAPRTGGYTPFGATAIRGEAARAMFAAMKDPRGERQFHNQQN